MHNINLIIYQPGFGGHLLEYLFSSDPTVATLMLLNTDLKDQSKLYSFDNSKNFQHWQDFHKNYTNKGALWDVNFEK